MQMIGFICKYTPIELLEAMDAEPVLMEPAVTNFDEADTMLHPNLCSYVKGVLEAFHTGGYDGIVLTTCCDSVRRLYDSLKLHYPDKFIYLLDVPRKTDNTAVRLYQEQLQAMADAYHTYSGHDISYGKLHDLLSKDNSREETAGGPRIGLFGARVSSGFRGLLREYGVRLTVDMTCTSVRRRLEHTCGTEADTDGKELLNAYARTLLTQFPCLRMADDTARSELIRTYAGRLDGIIYHTVKFCDVYSFEYADLRQYPGIPKILKVETDMTMQSEGQIRTRTEAFLESLGVRNHEEAGNRSRPAVGKSYVLGIDSGSTSTNGVLMDENGKIAAEAVIRTGAKTVSSAERVLQIILDKVHIEREDIVRVVSTGYGRVSIPFADQDMTEITCHARGARYFNKSVRTILDIGGQDSKAIRLNEEGDVTDFVMNDKCAAGTGRFLEMMARTLEMDVSELGAESMKATQNIEISSMCTVFAESEVISLIAQNKEKADIVHGIHKAIAGKAVSLLNRVGIVPELMMTGGVALNPGVVRAVEEKTGVRVCLCDDPEIVGAAGAALYGLDFIENGTV